MTLLSLHPDLGRSVGVGHLVRCAAIADAAAAHDVTTRLVVHRELVDLAPRSIAGRSDLLVTADPWSAASGDVALVDSYSVSDEELVALPSAVVALVDDLASAARPVDLLVNPDRDPGWTIEGPTVLAGPRYVPLRSTIRARPGQQRSGTLLVAAGGTDPTGLIQQVLDRMSSIASGFDQVIVLVGPGAPEPRVAAADVGRVELVRDPADVGELFASVGAAVTAGGMTMYELMASHVACAAVAVADNQVPAVTRLAALGAVIDASDGRLDAALDRLCDPVEVGVIAEKAVGVVDGRGAERIVAALLNLLRSGPLGSTGA